MRQALTHGEILGLVVRIKTAKGKSRVIEVNAGARYGSNQGVSHLRCHVADVTDKVRAERELRLRTRELTRVNEQLRSFNRELADLKDRYTDLYENAPAMYFSLDAPGNVVDCNQTFLATLERRREDVIGRSFLSFLAESERERCLGKFAELMETGAIEVESRWAKADGELIDVWIRRPPMELATPASGRSSFGTTASASTRGSTRRSSSSSAGCTLPRNSKESVHGRGAAQPFLIVSLAKSRVCCVMASSVGSRSIELAP